MSLEEYEFVKTGKRVYYELSSKLSLTHNIYKEHVITILKIAFRLNRKI